MAKAEGYEAELGTDSDQRPGDVEEGVDGGDRERHST